MKMWKKLLTSVLSGIIGITLLSTSAFAAEIFVMGVVPELLSCEVGINVVEGNYDACLVSTFASLDDLETYKKHPAHVAISTYCKKVRESRVACDFVIE